MLVSAGWLIAVLTFAFVACLTHFFYYFTALINVNIDHPEANREVLVFPLKDIKGVKTGSLYYGYYIMVPMDIRFILDDQTVNRYKAQVFADHQVLLAIPSWPYSPHLPY